MSRAADTTDTGAEPELDELLVDETIVSEFLSRQIDNLDKIEENLLGVESGADEGDVEGLQRFFHTLKGESALLNMSDVAELCHAVEDVIQNAPLADSAGRLLEVKDWLVTVMKHRSGKGPGPEPLETALAKLRDATAADAAPSASAPPATYQVEPYTDVDIRGGDKDLLRDFIEESVEHLDASEAQLLALESDPHEREALNAVFRAFHTIKGLAGFVDMGHIQDLAHKSENLLDKARRDEIELVGGNMDVVFASVDMMKSLVGGIGEALDGDGLLAEEAGLPVLMVQLVGSAGGTPPSADAGPEAAVPEPEFKPPTPEDVAKGGFIPLGKMPKKSAQAAPVTPQQAPPAAAPPAASAKTRGTAKIKEAMRVDAERLDHLIETIGELVIAQSMISQSHEFAAIDTSLKLAKDLDHLDKICRQLQEIGMSLRMVPVRPVFQKMSRLVRDLSKKQQRQVDFVVVGEETELDKNVVDKIGDPLVHMVRNAMDHGIEADPADRVALGKPERGRVELRAFHKGGNICIEIEDDGKGLDRDAIRAKAISRGLLRDGENIGDRELFALIFEAGFSTAAAVTDISGRGVGMDVVRRNIEELRGTVEIASEKGKGSVFTIKLPLTLAIIEGMVIRVGAEHYIVPTLSVLRLVRPRQHDISHVFDRCEMMSFEGEQLPLFRLARLFDVRDAKTEADEAMVVVIEDEGKKLGLMADELLGQQSIVIKTLGEAVQGIDGVAGGAIMSDGNVALILDTAGLVRVAHSTDNTLPTSETPAAAVDRETGCIGPASTPEPAPAEASSQKARPDEVPVEV